MGGAHSPWAEDLDCLESDEERTEEEKFVHMSKCIGLCNALDKEEELDDSDCMALAMSAPDFLHCGCAAARKAPRTRHRPRTSHALRALDSPLSV